MAARFVKVMRIRFPLPHGTVDVPRLLAVVNGEAGGFRGLRDHSAGAVEPSHAPRRPRAEKADDRTVALVRERIAADDRGREQPVQTDAGLEAPPAKPRKRRNKSDETLSVGTIAATMAGVIVVSFAGTALLPSILTRDPIASTTIAIAPPAVQPRPTEQVGVIQPIPDARPVQPPAPDLPAPASNDVKAVATTAPVLRTSSVPPARQAAAAPRRPATTRSALTAEEKAAVERGLRELEKAAGQAKP